ncbi:MAG: hypothetical protein ACE5GH_05560 [Fidelibacterota bacterium]
MSRVAVFVRDFELGTRIADAATIHGKEIVFPEPGANSGWEATEDTEFLIVDLNEDRYEPLDLIRRIGADYPQVTVVGFLSRVRKRAYDEAKKAGCTWVLPRSSLVHNLRTLFDKGRPDEI